MLKQSPENQVLLAENLKRYLCGLQERLNHSAQSYQQKCNVLCETGMMEETLQKFEQEYVQQTIKLIAQLVEHINNFDIPFVEKYIAKFEQPRNMVYQGYSGAPVYRIEGNMIYQGYSGTPVYRIEGNMIYEKYSGTPVYRIEGNMIYEKYSGKPVYRIEENMIYQGYSGTPVNRID